MMNDNKKNINNLTMKSCTDCKTTKTPLWRGGPAGPKSLCNACGIRYRKKKRAIEGIKKRADKKKDKQITSSTTTAAAFANITTAKVVANAAEKVDSFKMRLVALSKEALLPKSPSPSPSPPTPSSSSTWTLPAAIVKKQRCQRKRKLKEEEQAAFSLMAMSCGFVFA